LAWDDAPALPTVLLVRHGQASYGGPAYDVLSARGHAQAERLAADLTRRGFAAERVVSGRPARQRDTAAALGEFAVDPRWDEYDADDILAHHSGSGARLERPGGAALTPREFQDVLEAALLAWVAAGDASACAESWPAFAARVAAGLEAAAERTTLVCTSGGAIAAACVGLLGIAPEAFVTLNRVTVNTGVTKIVRGRSGTSLVSFNEHAHLEADALVTYR
jgi:broad specificity phosphatase PhoE